MMKIKEPELKLLAFTKAELDKVVAAGAGTYEGNDGLGDNYTLSTKYGPLRVTTERDEGIYKKPTISIMTRFENPKAIELEELDGNKHSGKWNHHGLEDEADIDNVICTIKSFLSLQVTQN